MSTQSEQERARQAYAAGRESRDADDVRMGQDNARIDGAATGARGGAR
ncbi:hypothetical protein [Streptomyces tendae]